MIEISLVLIGFGYVFLIKINFDRNVSQTLCKILENKKDIIGNRENKKIKVIGISDSSGGIYSTKGLDLTKILDHKKVNICCFCYFVFIE